MTVPLDLRYKSTSTRMLPACQVVETFFPCVRGSLMYRPSTMSLVGGFFVRTRAFRAQPREGGTCDALCYRSDPDRSMEHDLLLVAGRHEQDSWCSSTEMALSVIAGCRRGD